MEIIYPKATQESYSRILAAMLSFFCSFAIFIIAVGSDPYFHPTDIATWINDPLWLRECINGGVYNACTKISKFPLAYLANAQILILLQKSGAPIKFSIQLLNTLALALPSLVLTAGATKWRKGVFITIIYTLLLVLTPIPAFYLRSGALETQFGIFLGLGIVFGFIKSNHPDRSWTAILSNGCLLIACLYKDTTAILFITAVITACLLQFPRPSLKTILLAWLPGILTGTFFSIAWNLVRYKSILPVDYKIEAHLNRPDISQILTSMHGLVLSPNGGFIVFWGCAAGILLIFVLLSRIYRRDLLFATTLIIALMVFGISSMALWWAPFGWDAWGARLSIPYVLAGLICTLYLLTSTSSQIHTQRKSTIALMAGIALGSILISSSISYVMLGYNTRRAKSYELSMDGGCTGLIEEMQSMRNGHPNIQVKMWQAKSYWPCIEKRLQINPAAQK